MAGRGRGRGRGTSMSFNVDSLGFGRGEALPGALLQPPPVYPPLEVKPVPLTEGEEFDYLLALKQEYAGSMRESVYYVKQSNSKADIDRYSDKYQLGQVDSNPAWHPAWNRLPAELRVATTRSKKRVQPIIQPSIPRVAVLRKEDIAKQLDDLERNEKAVKSDEEKDEDEEEEDILFDEDDLEDDTDYNLTYFDNGEGDDEDDDLDDGPTY